MRRASHLLVTGLIAAGTSAACASTSNPLNEAMCERGLPDGIQDVSATPRRNTTNREVDHFIDKRLGFDSCPGKFIPMTGTERVRADAPLVRVFAIDLGENATDTDRRAVATALRLSGLFVEVAVMPRSR